MVAEKAIKTHSIAGELVFPEDRGLATGLIGGKKLIKPIPI